MVSPREPSYRAPFDGRPDDHDKVMKNQSKYEQHAMVRDMIGDDVLDSFGE